MKTALIKAEEDALRGVRSSIVGIAINFLLAVTKCVAGFLGHSFALIADGIESFSDVVSSSVVAFGLWWALRPPDKDHPYGHGKALVIDRMVQTYECPRQAKSEASISEAGLNLLACQNFKQNHPAMEAGISSHVRSIQEIAGLAAAQSVSLAA